MEFCLENIKVSYLIYFDLKFKIRNLIKVLGYLEIF